MGKFLFTLCLVVLATGCAQHENPPPTVTWYLEHPDEMQKKAAWCRDDMQRQTTGDCQNALEASRRKQWGSMKDAPPLDWNASDSKKP